MDGIYLSIFDGWADMDVSTFQFKFYRSVIADDRWKLYIEGLKNTLIIAAVACLIGIAIGVVVALIKFSHISLKASQKSNVILSTLNSICNLYTTVIRGTPAMIQLLILFSIIQENYMACVVGFGINSGAYVSEIIRAGLMSVDVGQTEAGRSLGLSELKTLRLIILPQAFKNILPALFNEFISLVKETSIAGYIAVRELTKVADGVKGRTFQTMPLFIAAICYLIIVIGLTKVQDIMERRLSKSDRR